MRFIYKIFISFLIIGAIVSCDLELQDPSSLPPEVALSDISGMRAMVNSQYRRVTEFSFYGQQANLHGDVLADNADIVNRTGRYEQEWVNAIGATPGRWDRYVSINESNFVIAKVGNLTGADPIVNGTPAERDQLKGESYFLRALNYFELHRVYSYEPGKEVSGWNEGVILRTTPTEGASNADLRARSTNLEGYQLMEADLLEAINLLPEPTGLAAGQFPYRASKMAARALLARLYLYWGRYGDAATQADLVLAYTQSPLTTAATWNGSWALAPHPESIFEASIAASDWSGVDGPNNSMNSIMTNQLSGSQYVLAGSPELIAAHEVGDVRLTRFVNTAGTLDKYQTRKWPGELGQFRENIPIIRRAEVLLIAAEAKARNNNEAGATTAINLLRTNRGLTATTATGAALLTVIMNERRIELAFEGHRFYDLKRLGLPISKSAASAAPALVPSDFRILGRLPLDQVVLNKNMAQNPGY